ncbi:MAG: pyrroline-5-carboxylate reductase [Clostridiales bacterium]|nr:pyrroline-5-carboxylate reductase [Clostridiales bacterium]
MKIGFIGAGNMASAILRGAVGSRAFKPDELYVYDIDSAKCSALSQELGINAAKSSADAVTGADAVLLAVKPVALAGALSEISGAVKASKPLIISIAAGQSHETLTRLLGFEAAAVRVMPNLNAAVGEAMSGYCCNSLVDNEQKKLAVKLLESFGEATEIGEGLFPAFDAVSGAGPAFCFMFVDALSRAAVKNGIPRDKAMKIAVQTVLGSVKYLAQSPEHPWELVDRVCSPGGITIEGVAALQEHGFEAAITEAVDVTAEKDKRM